MTDILIVRIGSLSNFFSGSPIKLEAVLHLIELEFNQIIGVHINRSKYISMLGRTPEITKEINGFIYKLYESTAPLEALIQSAQESDDGHETLFKDILGEKKNNLGLSIHWWNSLIFWVDFETRLLRCYDMEQLATAIFEDGDKLAGINVSTDFAQGE